MTDNVVADYRGLQARHGEFVGDVLNITATTLNLQRVGGDILIHGDAATEAEKTILTSDSKLGVGTLTPTEKLDVNGAIRTAIRTAARKMAPSATQAPTLKEGRTEHGFR